MSHRAVWSLSDAAGFVMFEPKSSVQARHGVRMMNGVHYVSSGRPFQVIPGNFSNSRRNLPKGTVVGYARRKPLTLLTPGLEEGTAFVEVLNINADPPNTVEGDDEPSNTSAVPD